MIDLKADINRPLSAILSLNRVLYAMGAAGLGVFATIVFEGRSLVLKEIVPEKFVVNYNK